MRTPASVTTAEGLKVATASQGRSRSGASIGFSLSRRTMNMLAGVRAKRLKRGGSACNEGVEEGGERRGRHTHYLVGAAIVNVEHVATNDRAAGVDDARLTVVLVGGVRGEHGCRSTVEHLGWVRKVEEHCAE